MRSARPGSAVSFVGIVILDEPHMVSDLRPHCHGEAHDGQQRALAFGAGNCSPIGRSNPRRWPMKAQRRVFILAAIVVLAAAPAAQAQLAVTSNDNKVMLDNGTVKIVQNPAPDTVTILDLTVSPPRVVAEIAVPGSVVGPPLSVALVANRSEGTVSVFSISGKTVTPVGKVTIADEKSGTSHAVFTPDGTMALVTRDGDHKISVLSVDGTKVEYTKRDINAGLRPYGIDVSSKGDFAAVANIGIGQGDTDTVSLIDVRAKPPRVVETVSVGQTPEGIKVSPDGRHVAVVVMNGSNKARESPFYGDSGRLVVLRAKGMKLTKVAEAPIGHWSQGAAFSPDGKTILVGNMVEKDVQVFSFDGRSLKEVGRIKVNGGPAAVRTAEK